MRFPLKQPEWTITHWVSDSAARNALLFSLPRLQARTVMAYINAMHIVSSPLRDLQTMHGRRC